MHCMTSHWKFRGLFTVQGGKGWCLVWSAIERSPSLPPCSHCSLLLCACTCSLPCSLWGDGIRRIPQFWKRERNIKPGQMRVGACLLQQQTFRSAQLSCETLSWNGRDWWKLLILRLSTGYRRSPDTTVMKGPALTPAHRVQSFPVQGLASYELWGSSLGRLRQQPTQPRWWIRLSSPTCCVSSWGTYCSLGVCMWGSYRCLQLPDRRL